ncbi:MAG: NUDIX hydrolase [Alphaproteobacteria bacterium]
MDPKDARFDLIDNAQPSARWVKATPSIGFLFLRDGAEGMEIFMAIRRRNVDYAAGALAYPGGRIMDQDADPVLRALTRADPTIPDPEFVPLITTLRQVFRETGVLLARPRGEEALVSGARLDDIRARYQAPLGAGEVTIREMVEREKLELAGDWPVLFAHWLTVVEYPTRFDGRFYVMALPEGQTPTHVGGRFLESTWITPVEAARAADAGEYYVVLPTRMNLNKLARWNRAEDAIAAARASRVVTIQPVTTDSPRGPIIRIPEEADYGTTEILLSEFQLA